LTRLDAICLKSYKEKDQQGDSKNWIERRSVDWDTKQLIASSASNTILRLLVLITLSFTRFVIKIIVSIDWNCPLISRCCEFDFVYKQGREKEVVWWRLSGVMIKDKLISYGKRNDSTLQITRAKRHLCIVGDKVCFRHYFFEKMGEWVEWGRGCEVIQSSYQCFINSIRGLFIDIQKWMHAIDNASVEIHSISIRLMLASCFGHLNWQYTFLQRRVYILKINRRRNKRSLKRTMTRSPNCFFLIHYPVFFPLNRPTSTYSNQIRVINAFFIPVNPLQRYVDPLFHYIDVGFNASGESKSVVCKIKGISKLFESEFQVM
jgi:hypothetical protein